jgi:diguanylate cyclase (GGDEF)-like protein
VTEPRRLEQELAHQAFHDSLTGLANRLLFQSKVERAVLRVQDGPQIIGVLFIDLDDLKLVNDTMGHEAGDDLLNAVGQRLTQTIRPSDTAARLGGDEFAVLVEDARAAKDVEAVAGRVVTTLAEPFLIGGSLVNGAASVGVATTIEATDAKELMRQADLALYAAKGGGKNRWRRYEHTLHAHMTPRMATRATLD